jgi:catechol 2,3-dioxygenase-like lactoylglutathione lyase family enzyme
MLIGIRHAALPVLDLKRALAFYTEHFGFKPYLTSDKDWVMITLGGTSLSLMPLNKITPNQGPARHLGILVQSPKEVDEHFKKMKASGYPHVQLPKLHRDSSYGFYFTDTEGNGLELIFVPYMPNPQEQESTPGIVLLAQGNKDPGWQVTFEKLLSQLKFHYPSSRCELAYMGFPELGNTESFEPLLEHCVLELAGLGCSQVLVVPVLLGSDKTVKDSISALVKKVQAQLQVQFPKLEIVLGAELGESPLVQEALIAATVESISKTFGERYPLGFSQKAK